MSFSLGVVWAGDFLVGGDGVDAGFEGGSVEGVELLFAGGEGGRGGSVVVVGGVAAVVVGDEAVGVAEDEMAGGGDGAAEGVGAGAGSHGEAGVSAVRWTGGGCWLCEALWYTWVRTEWIWGTVQSWG